MAVQWKEDLAVGVEMIDEQHKELFSRTNELLSACRLGKGKQEVTKLIEFLEEYVIKHFREEEGLQKRYGYPDIEKHKVMHDKFIQEVGKLKIKLNDEGSSLALIIEINQKVTEWLVNHIGRVDKQLGQFIRSKSN